MKTTNYPEKSIPEQMADIEKSMNDDRDYVNTLVNRLFICLGIAVLFIILLIIL